MIWSDLSHNSVFTCSKQSLWILQSGVWWDGAQLGNCSPGKSHGWVLTGPFALAPLNHSSLETRKLK